jgi:hypothetical protein
MILCNLIEAGCNKYFPVLFLQLEIASEIKDLKPAHRQENRKYQ